jgi:hypothetical protein
MIFLGKYAEGITEGLKGAIQSAPTVLGAILGLPESERKYDEMLYGEHGLGAKIYRTGQANIDFWKDPGPTLDAMSVMSEDEHAAILGDAAAETFLILAPLAKSKVPIIPKGNPRILIVGAETIDEFRVAQGLREAGRNVTVVNPLETQAARNFKSGGGNFIKDVIENLPDAQRFDYIIENYPFPTGPYAPAAEAFIDARIKRLQPGGSWEIITESSDFADALEAVGQSKKVAITRTEIPLHQAPKSTYPRVDDRFKITITKPN